MSAPARRSVSIGAVALLRARMRISVVGREPFVDGKSKKYTVCFSVLFEKFVRIICLQLYRTVVIYDGEVHERLIRFSQFHRFYHDVSLNTLVITSLILAVAWISRS